MSQSPRRSFTLVEMLVVMSVLAIVATMVYGAMEMAQRTAREAKTKATIAKLHGILMRKWDSYRTRRVPLDPIAYAKSSGYYTLLANGTLSTKDMARLKLNALRDLMRMELPDRWSDVMYNPSSPPSPGSDPDSVGSVCLVLPHRPALSGRYAAKYMSAASAVGAGASSPIWMYLSAKCLYMIATSAPEDAAQFTSDEISLNYTGDGLPLFIDGWGRPIQFIRWPVGFIAAPVPPATSSQAPWSTVAPYFADSNMQTGNPTTDPDPFDLMKVNATAMSGAAYAVYPLIYSCGSNPQRDSSGQFRSDINVGKSGGGSSNTYSYTLSHGNLDPYACDGTGQYLIGQPMASGGSGAPQHFQCIHNQRLEVR